MRSMSKKMNRAALLTTMLIAILSLAACGGAVTQPSDFSATTIEGEEFRLADKRGEVVALYFMAGW